MSTALHNLLLSRLLGAPRLALALRFEALLYHLNVVAIRGLECHAAEKALLGLKRVVALALRTSAPTTSLTAHTSVAIARNHGLIGGFSCARSRSGIQVGAECVDAALLSVRIALIVMIRLTALRVREHRVATIIVGALQDDSLGTQTALHLDVLMFTLDEVDHVAA